MTERRDEITGEIGVESEGERLPLLEGEIMWEMKEEMKGESTPYLRVSQLNEIWRRFEMSWRRELMGEFCEPRLREEGEATLEQLAEYLGELCHRYGPSHRVTYRLITLEVG